MFVRKKYINGSYYLYLVEASRKGDKITQISKAYLGPVSIGESGLREKLEELKKEKVLGPCAEIIISSALFRKSRTLSKAKLPLENTLPIALQEEIYDILNILRKKTGFLLCGMSTANAYIGNIRASQDLDIFVTTGYPIRQIHSILSKEGYTKPLKRMAQFVPVFSKKYPDFSASIVDVLRPGAFGITIDAKSFKRAVKMNFRKMRLKGMCIEEIMLTKMARNTAQDQIDVRLIMMNMKKNGLEPDWGYIEERATDWDMKTVWGRIKEIRAGSGW